jgi:hypothetical protein
MLHREEREGGEKKSKERAGRVTIGEKIIPR